MPTQSWTIRLNEHEIRLLIASLKWYDSKAGKEVDGLCCLLKKLREYLNSED
jgi:hypothetical protein